MVDQIISADRIVTRELLTIGCGDMQSNFPPPKPLQPRGQEDEYGDMADLPATEVTRNNLVRYAEPIGKQIEWGTAGREK